ncbi:1189_t:CDS:10 [Gigaspora margarita]|uniref:1189_t:CDS:1 n=1 Tax=Gigaspora margarita TaxID=4874 RepID=A0ABN7UHP2_GIGMA|nr:1189_t:CDS:10 [Gigaspora margarita]
MTTLPPNRTLIGTSSRECTEARTVILLVKKPNFTQVDHHKWLLKRLFKPLNYEKDDNIQVLYVSNTKLSTLIRSQNERKANDVYTPQNLPDLQEDDDISYKLMPNTRIITLCTKYRMIFLLDVTTSLATIYYNNRKGVLISEAIKVLYRCIEGLVQPFTIQDLDRDKALHFEPEISITVIAESSHFASNANLLPMIRDFPTMRVLLNGVIVTKNNVADIINNLHTELTNFQQEVAELRQKLSRAKFPVAYEMDVVGSKTEDDVDTFMDNKKNLWRLGSSGANLAYSLNAGLFAKSLLPDEGFPSLTIITDGVVKSTLDHMSADDDIIQQLCKEGIRCNIIQVGSHQGFDPCCNFGLLPDIEVLQFVTTATSGVFLYSENCPDISDNNSPIASSSQSSFNFYHEHMLIRETHFVKKKNQVRYLNSASDCNSYNFPWDPRSQPLEIEAMPARFLEYYIFVDVQQLISIRMRHGFNVDNIILSPGKGNNKTEVITIVMSRLWLPDVTIQYKIKGQWTGESNGLSRLKSPRIEIHVLADTELDIYLLNFQTARQNNDPNHPLFWKFTRLYNFLTTILETDELLKKLKTPKDINRLQLQRSIVPMTRVEILKQLWNTEQSSRNINFWYDDAKFDFLLSAETLQSNMNLDPSSEAKHISVIIEERLVTIKKYLSKWSTFTASDNVFVKFFNQLDTEKMSPISFCELRIKQEVGYLITVKFSFFNVDNLRRQKEIIYITNLINDLDGKNDKNKNYYICRRPLSSFLIRNIDYELNEKDISLDRQFTGRNCVIRSYLKHSRWSWLSDLDKDISLINKGIIAIQKLAFQYLCQARSDENCLLVFEHKNKKIFYRELEFPKDDSDTSSVDQKIVCGVQHHIFISDTEIITELWVEPLQHSQMKFLYETFVNKIFAADRLKLSQLVTFDQISYIARSRAKQHPQSLALSTSKTFNLSKLFQLSVLLRSSGLIVASYNLPSFLSNNNRSQRSVVNAQQTERSISSGNYDSNYNDSRAHPESSPYLRRGSASHRNSPFETSTQRKLSISVLYEFNKDMAYFVDRDLIAKLKPTDRDFALLHLFVEKNLSKYADGEVDTTIDNCKDSIILKNINNGLSMTELLQETTTAITYALNLHETRCFIKIVNSGSFLLIFIPSFKVLLDAMAQHNGISAENKITYFGILIFLCKRPEPSLGNYPRESSYINRDQPLAFEPISIIHDSSIPVNNPLDPILLSCSFPEYPMNFTSSDISNLVAKEIHNVTKLYSRGFIRSIYASVLQKHKITENDFHKAIDSCAHFYIDIDITGYVNVHVQASRQDSDSEDANDIYQKFVAVLGHYFEPITFADCESENSYYYYRPPFKKSSNSSVDAHDYVTDIPGSFLETFNCAENPLFIRLECIFKKPTKTIPKTENTNPNQIGSDAEKIEPDKFVQFPISSLPTSYSYTIDGKLYDFSPESIGTDTSPVESSDDTTATLRLICLTLPQFHEVNNAHSTEHKNDFNQTSTNSNKFLYECLSDDKKEALNETQSRIDWLTKEEIMHMLLKSQSVDRSVLSFIQTQLRNKNPFVDFPTTFDIPLSFVRRKHGKPGHELFLESLSKADMRPFTLNKVEDCFYISEDDEIEESLVSTDSRCEASPAFGAPGDGEITEEQIVSQVPAFDDYPDDGDDELLFSGLGIRSGISDISDISEDDDIPDLTSKSIKRNVVHKQLFWLLFIPQETSIQMYFYSQAVPARKRSEIIKHLRNCIIKVSERVNRIILLTDLNHTHNCSKYLVPPNPDDSSDSESSSEDNDLSTVDNYLVDVLSKTQDDDGQLNVSKKFKVGQFECPLVYRQTFSLHWRLKPNNAIRGIESSVLNSFAVNNRKHMFVYAKENSIVYIKISEVDTLSISSDYEKTDDVSRSASSSQIIHPTSTTQSETSSINAAEESRRSPSNKSGGSPKTSTTVSPGSRKPTSQQSQQRVSESRELVVEVFGIDPPGKEITEELMALLENKLMTNITLTAMSTFLVRNPKFNPTREDVDFILPVIKPSKRLCLAIPLSIKNTYTFLVYFKQNLSHYHRVFSGSEVTNAIERHHNATYGVSYNRSSNMDDGRKSPISSYDVQLHEFSFYYNINTQPRSATSAFESSVGEGIAGLCITLIDRNGRPVFELPISDKYIMDDTDMAAILSYISEEEVFIASNSKRVENTDYDYSLHIDLWSQGQFNYEILFERIRKSFRQCLCDYFIEISITQGLGRISDQVESNSQTPEHYCASDRECSPAYIDQHVQKVFIEPCMAILKKSVNLANPALHSLQVRLDMPSWMIDDFLAEVHELLSDIHIIFTPVILRTIPSSINNSDNMYEIYRPKHSISATKQAMTARLQYLLIAGLKELNRKYGTYKLLTQEDRRSSLGSDGAHSRRSSVEDLSGDKSNIPHSRKSSFMTAQAQHRHLLDDIMMYTIPHQEDQSNSHALALYRSCFLAMSMDGFDLTIYIYNWQKHYSDKVFSAMKKISDWHNQRIELLNSILYQKMGLFCHAGISFKSQVPFQSMPNTPRSLQSPIISSQRVSQIDPSLSQRVGLMPIGQNTTDLSLIVSLINERFPHPQKAEGRAEDIKKNSDLKYDTNNLNLTEFNACGISFNTFDLNKVLKNARIDSYTEKGHTWENRDALKRHGPPFIDAWIRQAKISQVYDNEKAVYSKWAKRIEECNVDNTINTPEVIKKSDLAIIFRTSRLLHFCRTPLLFGGNADSFTRTQSAVRDFQTSSDTTFSRWYQDMSETFLQEYSYYLEEIGMQVVIGGKSGVNLVDDGISKSSVTENVLANSPAVFLLKVLQGGSIMCEVRIQGVFVSVTLYILNQGQGLTSLGFSDTDNDRGSLRIFTEECGRFRKMIHVNSFVYDFHLRYINHVLESQSKTSPAFFNVLDVIRAFIRHNSRPAHFSCNRIYHDSYDKELGSIPDDLFKFMISAPQRYGFRAINFNDEPIACFATSICGDQCSLESCDICSILKNEALQITLVFTSSNQTSIAGTTSLEYFVIVLNDNYASSDSSSSVRDSSHRYKNQTSDLFSNQDLQERKYVLINRTRERLKLIINQAIQFKRREDLWKKLSSMKPSDRNNANNSTNYSASLSITDFLDLTKQWYSRELVTLSPDFKDILDLKLNWVEVINFLSSYYSDLTRELYDDIEHIRHLVIFNQRSHDLLIHFILPKQGEKETETENNDIKLVVNAVCKESKPNFEGLELQFVADITRTIGYWMWQRLF